MWAPANAMVSRVMIHMRQEANPVQHDLAIVGSIYGFSPGQFIFDIFKTL